MMFSIPAVKGIEFGDGFSFASLRGSYANDSFYYDDTGAVKTRTNHNGGINGGITNGMAVNFRIVVKPTPSISKNRTQSIRIRRKTATSSSKGATTRASYSGPSPSSKPPQHGRS